MVSDFSQLAANDESLDRVRRNTAAAINQKIDEKMLNAVRDYARRSNAEISERIRDLDHEWDTERVLEANASLLAFTGLMLGIFVHPYWFWLPSIVLPLLFQHAVQGWCPPLPVIRRLGVRTPNEIDQEKYTLKTLRGDFSDVVSTSVPEHETRTESAFQAVKA